MQHFESELERAVVLTLFIPLIMSSGGNSGSQATSLIIRAIALREVQRLHESLNNLTPADVVFGRGQQILEERERIKRLAIHNRRFAASAESRII
jgi:hypothetical protein